MNGKRNRWLLLLVVVLVAAAVFWSAQPKPIVVETAQIEMGPLSVMISEQGKTRARERYTVAAPIGGLLTRTSLQNGDRVEAGQLLVQIMPAPIDSRARAIAEADLATARARAQQFVAEVKAARSMRDEAKAEAERRKQLHAKGLIGAETRDQYAQAAVAAENGLASAIAAERAARAAVASARARLLGEGGAAAAFVDGSEGVAVYAPVAGQILRVHEESQRVVSSGAPLFDLGGVAGLELVIDLLTEEAVQVRPGNRVVVSAWGGAVPLIATVRYVEPGAFTKISTLGVEEQRVNVIADLNDAEPSLGAGYRIEAAIEVWANDQVLRVPNSALFRRQGQWQAFAVVGGVAEAVEVSLGHRGVDSSEVLEGLAEGDVVVVFPPEGLTDGASVTGHER